MSEQDRGGTFEMAAEQIKILLGPLRGEIAQGGILDVFEELGYRFPSSVGTHADLAAAVTLTLDANSAFGTAIGALASASDDDDLVALGAAITKVLSSLQQLISGLDALSTGLTAAATAAGGLSAGEISDFVADLPIHLVEYSIVRCLDENVPLLAFLLELVGVIERTEERTNSTDPVRPPFTRVALHLDRLPKALTAPGELATQLYGWGTPAFDGIALFEKVAAMLSRLGYPSFFDQSASPPTLDLLVAEMRAEAGALVVQPNTTFGEDLHTQDADAGVTGSAVFKLRAPDGAKLIVHPNARLEFSAPGQSTTSGEVRLRLEYAAPSDDDPVIIFGSQGGVRLEAKKSWFQVGATLEWDAATGASTAQPALAAAIEGGSFVLLPPAGDGLLGSFLPADGVTTTFDLKAGLDRNGFFFEGSGVLQVVLPVHKSLGPITVKKVVLGIETNGSTLGGTAAVSFDLSLGPFLLAIDQIGVRVDAAFDHPAPNLGFVDLGVGLKPPSGAGLSVNGGPVKGGGFLTHNPARGRYAGVATLSLMDLAISAYGVIDTKVPEGFSLLVAIQSRIPPIPLGLGFTLLGVGGWLGINRTADLDVVCNGLRDGGLAHVLYPENPIDEFDQIIAETDRIFPIKRGRVLIGPTVKIGWGTPTLITADIGVIYEFPDPSRIAVIGVVRCYLPDPDTPMLRLQASFLGTIDLAKGQLAFDASLFDSKLLSFSLDGDMSARLQIGLIPNYLVTVGGFHPAYTPPPMGLPALRRLTLSLLGGDNPRLRAELYFARTSNSFQVGASVELYAAVSKFNIYGFLGFDSLIQVRPTKFSAEVKATLAVRVGDDPIMSVGVDFLLEGPSPWHAKGSAHFKLCWFLSFSVSFDRTWGDIISVLAGVIDVLPLLGAALGDSHNWHAPLPSGMHALVTLRRTDDQLVDPGGTLIITQKLVPLDLTIDRFSSLKPQDANRFSITAVATDGTSLDTDPTDDEFAAAEFLDMSDAEKLARPSFERFSSGVKIASAEKLVAGDAIGLDVDYERIILDKDSPARQLGRVGLDIAAFDGLVRASAVSRSPLAKNAAFAPQSARVALAQETFAVVSATDLSATSPRRELSYTEAVEELAAAQRAAPSALLQIVTTAEVA